MQYNARLLIIYRCQSNQLGPCITYSRRTAPTIFHLTFQRLFKHRFEKLLNIALLKAPIYFVVIMVKKLKYLLPANFGNKYFLLKLGDLSNKTCGEKNQSFHQYLKNEIARKIDTTRRRPAGYWQFLFTYFLHRFKYKIGSCFYREYQMSAFCLVHLPHVCWTSDKHVAFAYKNDGMLNSFSLL